MRNNKKIIAASIFAISVFTVIGVLIFNQYKKNTVHCTANSITTINDYTLRAVFTYDFYWGNGAVIINGQLFQAGKNLGKFSRKVFFTYSIDGNGYNMTSTRATDSLSDQVNTSTLEKVLSDFYLKEKKQTNIAIFNQGKHNYVLAPSNFPSFYCYQ